MKKIIYICILLILNSCGYTALYKNNNNKNIKVTITEINGDKKINDLIKLELNNYLNAETTNNFNLKIKTDYNKKINTKDTTGKALDYQLTLTTTVQINLNGKDKSSSFFETFKIKNSSDTFALNEYENIVKKNFARSTKEKIILELISIE